jgi:hypothetical protein
MKLLHLTFHFEYGERIEAILDRHEIRDYVRLPMMEGKDLEGKHYGSQVFPGSTSVVQAQVPEDKVEGVFEDLRAFKEERRSHRHLEALLLPVEARLE